MALAQFTVHETLRAGKQWLTLNRLEMNYAKTKEIAFSLSANALKSGPRKLLGFIIDNKLTWEDQIDSLCTKLSRVGYLLRHIILAQTGATLGVSIPF